MLKIVPISYTTYGKQKFSNKKNNVAFKSQQGLVLEKEYMFLKKSGLNPIKAFMDIRGEQALLEGLLKNILQDENMGIEFVKDVLQNPRKAIDLANILPKKIGSSSDIQKTFLPNNLYTILYEKVVVQKFNEAKTNEELLAIRPDWRGDALLQKHRKLYGSKEFELGKIPCDLSKNELMTIVNYLKSFMQNGGAKQPVNIQGLFVGNKNYSFEYFVDGKTDKNVFGIILPNNKKYILKMASEDKKSLDAPFALGTLAKINTYMTQNKSRNTAPLLYYNHDKNFLIYEYIEHISVNGNTRDLLQIQSRIPDYKALGLQFNDSVGSNNCFLLSENSNLNLKNSYGFNEGVENKEWISVDDDHVTFANYLHPHIRGYHSYLPNGMQFCV